MCDELAGATCLSSLCAQRVRGCSDIKATVSPGPSMAVLPCANPHGKLRVGCCGLKDPHGFWLFTSLFFIVC